MKTRGASLFVNWLLFSSILSAIVSLVLGQKPSAARAKSVSLETLAAGKLVNGFRTVAVYADDRDKSMGAR